MNLKIYRRLLIILIITVSLVMGALVLTGVFSNMPGDIWLSSGDGQEFNLSMPYSLKIDSGDIYVSAGSKEKIPADEITIDLDKSFSLSSSGIGTYNARVYLFNLIPAYTIEVNVVTARSYYIGGELIGIALNTNGILVLGSGTVTKKNGTEVSPSKGILKSGDYIKAVDGIEVSDKEKFISIIQESAGKSLTITVLRNEVEIDVVLKPVLANDGTYKIGAWVRDDTAGVGTLTFVDPTDGSFGALGHGITDVDTGTLLSVSDGEVYTATALSINKGEEGNPGEIVGAMNRSASEYIGEMLTNTSLGVYGLTTDVEQTLKKLGINDSYLYEIGYAAGVKKGEIEIVSAVLGTLEFYTAEITELNYNSKMSEKAIKIKVTDERLLEATGGIVQGMSGSPIIQDGRLIGAVTHVTVDDPSEGYGIFIEAMIQ
jgi:stage IV sporulation protein B